MAHAYLDQLVSFCLPFAQDQLGKRGEFYPFAATVHFDGALTPLAIDDGDERPKPSEMILRFVELIRSFVPRGGLEASAICYDGLVSLEGRPKRDAITVELEHANGECVKIFQPYKKRLIRGYAFDPLVAIQGERRIFTEQAG